MTAYENPARSALAPAKKPLMLTVQESEQAPAPLKLSLPVNNAPVTESLVPLEKLMGAPEGSWIFSVNLTLFWPKSAVNVAPVNVPDSTVPDPDTGPNVGSVPPNRE